MRKRFKFFRTSFLFIKIIVWYILLSNVACQQSSSYYKVSNISENQPGRYPEYRTLSRRPILNSPDIGHEVHLRRRKFSYPYNNTISNISNVEDYIDLDGWSQSNSVNYLAKTVVDLLTPTIESLRSAIPFAANVSNSVQIGQQAVPLDILLEAFTDALLANKAESANTTRCTGTTTIAPSSSDSIQSAAGSMPSYSSTIPYTNPPYYYIQSPPSSIPPYLIQPPFPPSYNQIPQPYSNTLQEERRPFPVNLLTSNPFTSNMNNFLLPELLTMPSSPLFGYAPKTIDPKNLEDQSSEAAEPFASVPATFYKAVSPTNQTFTIAAIPSSVPEPLQQAALNAVLTHLSKLPEPIASPNTIMQNTQHDLSIAVAQGVRVGQKKTVP